MSFQRFAPPPGGIIDRAPTSLGALPLWTRREGEHLVPVPDDECFWIGLALEPGASPIALQLQVELASGRALDASSGEDEDLAGARTLLVPDVPRIDGVRRADGRFDVLARRAREAPLACERVRLRVAAATAPAAWRETTIRLVDVATFSAESGLAPPAPLDPAAGYGGWRLP